jgi:NTE family protein
MSGDAGDRVAFVLGGGGLRGAFEIGMLRALIEKSIEPDLVVGTSIGAFNGAAIAADPSPAGVERITSAWSQVANSRVYQESLVTRAANLIRHRTHLHSNQPLRELIERWVPARTFEDLTVPFECVAACIEDAAEHWFGTGPLIEAILASSAVPGLLPPVEINGRHYIDGGVVNSIPVSRALDLGAGRIYVLQVGHIDAPLEVPAQPWDVAMVAFEVARRHRFMRDMASLPDDVEVHVLPTGETQGRYNDPSKLRYADASVVSDRIERAYRATVDYLESRFAS